MYPHQYGFAPWVWRDPRLWGREEQGEPRDLIGYQVDALDGKIGTVDSASYDIDDSWLVVDTGPWIFGRQVLLPAGTVQHIDHLEHRVYVDREKEEIRGAPEYDQETFGQPEFRQRLGRYYDDSYRRRPASE